METMTYILVQWPYSQELMDYEWFNEEVSLADCDDFGSAAYFIPLNRWQEFQEDRKNENDLNGLENQSYEE